MGLIAFLKDAGEKLFGSNPEVKAAVAEPTQAEKLAAASTAAAQAIQAYLKTQSLPAESLDLSFNAADGTVTVRGEVASQELREKIVLCCGNVDGVNGPFLRCRHPDAAELVVIDELGLGGVLAVEGVTRIFPHIHRPRGEASGVEQEQTATQGVAHAGDDLDDFERLK